MVRRTPQGQRRFEQSAVAREEVVSLTQGEYQALRMMAQGRPGKEYVRQNFASRGLISSAIASKMTVTEKGHRALDAHAQKTVATPQPENVAPSDSERESQREKWLRKNAPPFRRAAP